MWNGNALAMNESRERSLKTHDRYFGHAIHKRARMYHYNDTKASASEVISRLSQAYDPSRSRIVRLKVNRPPPPPQVVETPPTSARDASDSDSPSPRSRSESLSPSGHGSQDNAELLKALGTMHQRTTDDLKKRLEEEKLAHLSTQAKLSQQLEERLALADQLEKEKLGGSERYSTIRSECERLEIERDDWRRKYEDVDTLRTREAGEFDNKIREANVTIEALQTELQRAKDAEDRAISEAKEATTRAENAERDRMATLTVRSQDANSSITKVDKATEFAETSWQSIDATTKPESGNGGIELSKPKRNWWRKLLGKLSGGRK